jgi:hypothetical protein
VNFILADRITSEINPSLDLGIGGPQSIENKLHIQNDDHEYHQSILAQKPKQKLLQKVSSLYFSITFSKKIEVK